MLQIPTQEKVPLRTHPHILTHTARFLYPYNSFSNPPNQLYPYPPHLIVPQFHFQQIPNQYQFHQNPNPSQMLLNKRNSTKIITSHNPSQQRREKSQKFPHMHENNQHLQSISNNFRRVQTNGLTNISQVQSTRINPKRKSDLQTRKTFSLNQLQNQNTLRMIRKLDDTKISDTEFRKKIRDLCSKISKSHK